MGKTFLVMVPAYNAGPTIAELLEKISKIVNRKDIVVIDDGSLDQTFEISQSAGVVVLKHERNKGKGEALKTGFEYAKEKNYDHVITIDADLQHDPESIPSFIHKAENIYPLPSGEIERRETHRVERSVHPYGCPSGQTEVRLGEIRRRVRVRGNRIKSTESSSVNTNSPSIIIGTRKRNLKNMPFARWLTNNLSSVIVSVLSGQSIRDSQSGYRLIPTQVLKNVRLESKKYDLEPELLIKASRKGFKIEEVPIRTIYTGGKSFINPFVDTGRFIKLMWRSLWW